MSLGCMGLVTRSPSLLEGLGDWVMLPRGLLSRHEMPSLTVDGL